MVKEVRVVSDTELFARWFWRAAFVCAPFVFIWFAFDRHPVTSSIVVISAVGAYFLLGEMLYRGRLKDRLKRRDARLTPFEDGGLEEFDRCIAEINELVQGGLQSDDIRRKLLMDEKFARPAALAALEEAQDGWPRLPLFLRWRKASIQRQIFRDYKYAPVEEPH